VLRNRSSIGKSPSCVNTSLDEAPEEVNIFENVYLLEALKGLDGKCIPE